jgi:FkbM family methyltransferase
MRLPEHEVRRNAAGRGRVREYRVILQRLLGLIGYNRDWAPYLIARYRRPAKGALTTYRLRNGQAIVVRDDARFTLNEIYLDRVYDVPGVEWAACRSVLDLGANVGIFGLYVASRAPQAAIHCYEPESTNFAILERNLAQAGARARAYKMAVSAESGTGFLDIHGGSTEFALSANGSGNGSERVECVDLDRVFALAGVEEFDFVKMDIEGAERDILARCSDAQLKRMRALSLEWHHPRAELETLAERFRRLGFKAEIEIVDGHVTYRKARQA